MSDTPDRDGCYSFEWTYEESSSGIRHLFLIEGIVLSDGDICVETCELRASALNVCGTWHDVPHDIVDVRHNREAWKTWGDVIEDILSRKAAGHDI